MSILMTISYCNDFGNKKKHVSMCQNPDFSSKDEALGKEKEDDILPGCCCYFPSHFCSFGEKDPFYADKTQVQSSEGTGTHFNVTPQQANAYDFSSIFDVLHMWPANVKHT